MLPTWQSTHCAGWYSSSQANNKKIKSNHKGHEGRTKDTADDTDTAICTEPPRSSVDSHLNLRYSANRMATDFKIRLQKGPIVCDGAMGTLVYAKGVFINRCYDELNL